jgi:large subunit ribosomal protein L25
LDLRPLNADIRTTKGNGPARELRRQGKIPAVLYGPDTEPISLSVSANDIETAIRKRTGKQLFFNILVQNGESKEYPVLLKELQRHPVSGSYLHADFYEIAEDRKLAVRIPVTVTGKSPGVEMGGILQIIRRELDAICLPKDIPNAIEIDVSEMNIGDSIHIEEISAENVEFPAEVNFTVLTVVGKKAEVLDEEEEGEESEEGEVAEEAAAE